MKWIHAGVVASTAAMLFASFTVPAHADVVNGGFEAGTLAGWTATGDTSFSGVDPFAARTAPSALSSGRPLLAASRNRSRRSPAPAYNVSFSLSLADSAQPNSFSWSWNGVKQHAELQQRGRLRLYRLLVAGHRNRGHVDHRLQFPRPPIVLVARQRLRHR